MLWLKISFVTVYFFMVGIQPYLLNREKGTFWAGVIILSLEVASMALISKWLIVPYFLAIPLTFTLSLKASAGVNAFTSNKGTTLNI